MSTGAETKNNSTQTKTMHISVEFFIAMFLHISVHPLKPRISMTRKRLPLSVAHRLTLTTSLPVGSLSFRHPQICRNNPCWTRVVPSLALCPLRRYNPGFIFPRSENNYCSVACDNSGVMSLWPLATCCGALCG